MQWNLKSGFARRRPLFWFALAFCAGICLDAATGFSLSALLAFFTTAAAIAVLASLYFRRFLFATSLLSALILGVFAHAANFRILARDNVARVTPECACFAWVRGTIVEAESRSNQSDNDKSAASQRVAWTLELDALGQNANTMQPASGRIRGHYKDHCETRL